MILIPILRSLSRTLNYFPKSGFEFLLRFTERQPKFWLNLAVKGIIIRHIVLFHQGSILLLHPNSLYCSTFVWFWWPKNRKGAKLAFCYYHFIGALPICTDERVPLSLSLSFFLRLSEEETRWMEESVSMRNHPVLSDHPVLNGRKRRAFFSNCNANWLLNIRSLNHCFQGLQMP